MVGRGRGVRAAPQRSASSSRGTRNDPLGTRNSGLGPRAHPLGPRASALGTLYTAPVTDLPRPDLDLLFRPRSVAVAGASTNVDCAGPAYVRSLKEFGFEGPVYPINPRADEVAGYKAYPSLEAIPGDVDLVISCIPAAGVLS